MGWFIRVVCTFLLFWGAERTADVPNLSVAMLVGAVVLFIVTLTSKG